MLKIHDNISHIKGVIATRCKHRYTGKFEVFITAGCGHWRCSGISSVCLRAPIEAQWCVSKIAIIGSDNGLSPGRHKTITQTNAGILLTQTLRTNFSEIFSKIHNGPNRMVFILCQCWPHVRRSLLPIIMLPDGDFLKHCTYVFFLSFFFFDYLGECSHWGNIGRMT